MDIDLAEMDVDWILDFMKTQSGAKPSTRHVLVSALSGFYRFLNDQFDTKLDLDLLSGYLAELNKEHKQERPKGALDFEISRVIEAVVERDETANTERKVLRILRDKAIILTLAGCDLQAHELCALRKGDIDYRRNVVRTENGERSLSQRSADSIRKYVKACSGFDKNFGRKLESSPLFLRHDRKAGSRMLPLTTQTIADVVNEYAEAALGGEAHGRVTTRDFRKYFLNSESLMRSLDLLHPEVVRSCRQLFEMQHYDEAIFTAMRTVEETIRAKAHLSINDIGKDVAIKALNPDNPIIKMSEHYGEQESAKFLYWGALGVLKNPRSHRSINMQDPITAYECLAFASWLLGMLDDAH